MLRYPDREAAGRRLASALGAYAAKTDTIVLGLPRGGVIVAAQVASALRLPLDTFTVRKLGVPWNPELAVGAIATGDVVVFDHDGMRTVGLSMHDLAPIIEMEERELARRDAVFRAGRGELAVRGKTAIVVDDGLATGATMTAAVEALRKLGARRIVCAVPVGAEAACTSLRALADECECLEMPHPFYGVGAWYDDFHDVSDQEVLDALDAHPPAPQPA
ncbi:MAG: hypothetical protein IT359_17045 [Gemmatimonadaceae bacterium]|nr:hypothetical protein [Gemmatimonadaceae bacterium]